jgi:hypothetical protein
MRAVIRMPGRSRVTAKKVVAGQKHPKRMAASFGSFGAMKKAAFSLWYFRRTGLAWIDIPGYVRLLPL